MGNHYDVIVVGLGAMGSATCYHLAGRRAKVLGLERFDLPHAQGSSHGYSRHTKTAVYVDTPYEPFIGRSFELWRLLEGETGQQILITTGYLRMANTGSWDHLQGRVQHEILTADELTYRYPQFTLAPDYHGLYDPNGGLLRPELGIASHIIQALRRGAEIHSRETVTGWKETPGCVEVQTDHGRYTADQVVFTGGSWTGQLIEGLGISLTVTRQPLAWVWPARNAASFEVGSLPIWQIPAPEENGEHYGFPMMSRPSRFQAGPPQIRRAVGSGSPGPQRPSAGRGRGPEVPAPVHTRCRRTAHGHADLHVYPDGGRPPRAGSASGLRTCNRGLRLQRDRLQVLLHLWRMAGRNGSPAADHDRQRYFPF